MRNEKGQFIKGHKVNVGRSFSAERNKKISESRKGIVFSEETKRKMSLARKGKPNGVLGKHWKLSEETKLKMRGREHSQITKNKIRQKLVGILSPHWKGGISKQRGYRAFIEGRRRIRKRDNGGSHTFGEWETLKAQYDWICLCCRKSEPEITLSEDHIIPLSKGGSDNIENIQPLCRSCNSKKHEKVIKYLWV